jgi:hypothetical protein
LSLANFVCALLFYSEPAELVIISPFQKTFKKTKKIRCDSMPFSDFQALEKVSIA